MSTLLEIESAVSSLPPTQQESLLHWLQSRIVATAAQKSPQTSRREWLARLADLRQHGLTARAGSPLQQVMDDLRGE